MLIDAVSSVKPRSPQKHCNVSDQIEQARRCRSHCVWKAKLSKPKQVHVVLVVVLTLSLKPLLP